ncbi:MAG: urease accessory UreF family protein [Pseudomonadota bacterium]
MSTDLLTLTQWLSPAFPLGSFAYSHGLETAISDGKVRDATSLQDWLEIVVARGGGWSDAILLCATLRGEDVRGLARALAGSRERLEETEAQGAAFASTLRAMGQEARDGPLPVALGEAARALDLAPETVASMYLQSFTSNLVSCAVRFVPLGQSTGQTVLSAMAPLIDDTARRAAQTRTEALYTGAVFSDISAMRHEAQDARIFRT